jgi:hypothetical protein
MMIRRVALVLAVLTVAVWGSGPVPPPVNCGRSNAGAFWPEAANRDASIRRRAERCGTLRYCARTTFGWKWQPLTVNFQSLVAKASGTPHRRRHHMPGGAGHPPILNHRYKVPGHDAR